MKTHLQQRWNGMVAFAVAALLALQMALAPLAIASTASASPVDAFGNPLCITHLDQQEPASAPDKERTLAPDCCTLACGMAASLAPVPRAVFLAFDPFAQPSQRIFDGYGDHLPAAHDALSGHPRGPPAIA